MVLLRADTLKYHTPKVALRRVCQLVHIEEGIRDIFLLSGEVGFFYEILFLKYGMFITSFFLGKKYVDWPIHKTFFFIMIIMMWGRES